MANTIDEFISPKGFQQLEAAEKALESLATSVDVLSNKSISLTLDLKGVTDLKSYVQAAKAVVAINRDLVKSQRELENLRAAEERANKAEADKRLAEEKLRITKEQAAADRRAADEMNRLAIANKKRVDGEKLAAQMAKDRIDIQRKEIALQNAQMAQQNRLQKATMQMNNAYVQLSKEYDVAAMKARHMIVVFGENNAAAKAAAAHALELANRLKAADAAVGQFRRNVGNYNMVGMQFNQLLRELPNAAYSMQTFIMSLSNNMGYFVESVAAARKGGASFGAILGMLGKSMFGVVGIASMAVAAFTFFTMRASKAKDETKSLADELKDLEKTTSQNVNKNLAEFEMLARAVENDKLNQKTRIEAAQKIIDMGYEATKGMKAEQLVADGLGKTYEKLKQSILAVAYAREYGDKIAKISLAIDEQQLKVAEANLKVNEKQVAYDKMIAADRAATRTFTEYGDGGRAGSAGVAVGAQIALSRAESEQTKALKKLEELKKQKASFEASLDELINDWGTDIFDNKNKTDKKIKIPKIEVPDMPDLSPLQTLEAAQSRQLAALTERYNNHLMSYKQYLREYEELQKYHKVQLLGTEIGMLERSTQFLPGSDITGYHDDLKRLAELRHELAELTKPIQPEASSMMGDWEAQSLIEIERLYATGEIKKREYEKRLTKLAKEHTTERLKMMIQEAEKSIELMDPIRDIDDIVSARNTIAGLYKQIGTIMNDDEKKIKQWADNVKTAVDSVKSVFSSYMQMQVANSRARMDMIRDEMDMIRNSYNDEINMIQMSVMTAEEKNRRTAELNAEAAARQSQLRHMEAQERIRIARLEKAAAIMEATVAVAAQVASNISMPWVAAAIGAAGAAQIAMIASQPIPQYYKGTKSSEEGLAWTGERGQEMIITPDGKLALTPNKATLMYLEKGTEVKTAQETKQILEKADGLTFDQYKSVADKSTRRIVGALKRKDYRMSHIYTDYYKAKFKY